MSHSPSDTFVTLEGDGRMVPPPLPPPMAPPQMTRDHPNNMSIREMMAASGVPANSGMPPMAVNAPRPPATSPPRSSLPQGPVSSTPKAKQSLNAKTSKSAKRRATNAFLIDPTMSLTLQRMKDKSSEAQEHPPLDTTTGGNQGELAEIELQMLRGIFAAHDDNKDGIISKSQLAEALVSLGYSPTEKLMTKFFLENAKEGKKHWRISLKTFLSAASKWLDSAEDCSEDVMFLFETFDKSKSGNVSAQVVRHLLHEAIAPTRLSRQETEEFLSYSNIGGKRSRHINLSKPVDYEDLVDKLMF